MKLAEHTEVERFSIIFDRTFKFVEKAMLSTPEDKYEWVPVESNTLSFGERVDRITIKGLYVHIMVAEVELLKQLANAEDGAVLKTPINRQLSQDLFSGDFIAMSKDLHSKNMEVIASFDQKTLAKTIIFNDCVWSIMGFLWAIYGHRNYHLGNMDIYMRQGELAAPDYFIFSPKDMA